VCDRMVVICVGVVATMWVGVYYDTTAIHVPPDTSDVKDTS
jgi:hypothetical protein